MLHLLLGGWKTWDGEQGILASSKAQGQENWKTQGNVYWIWLSMDVGTYKIIENIILCITYLTVFIFWKEAKIQ